MHNNKMYRNMREIRPKSLFFLMWFSHCIHFDMSHSTSYSYTIEAHTSKASTLSPVRAQTLAIQIPLCKPHQEVEQRFWQSQVLVPKSSWKPRRLQNLHYTTSSQLSVVRVIPPNCKKRIYSKDWYVHDDDTQGNLRNKSTEDIPNIIESY